MTDLPAAAITAAAKAIHRLTCPVRDEDVEPQDTRAARAALEAAAPHITAAEREKIRAAITEEYGPSEARQMRRKLLRDTP